MRPFTLVSSSILCAATCVIAWVQEPQSASPALAAPAPAIAFAPAKLDRLDELTCIECHSEIVEEWAVSAHALAWVDQAYQDELKGRKKPESCHGCHIPVPLHAGDPTARPDPRKDAQHFGVSCDSCHLAPDGAMLGPVGAKTDAHASKRSDTLLAPGSNALCSSCHKTSIGPVIGIAKDFEAAGKAAKGESCVGCHFAPLREVDDGAGGKRTVRSHALQTPRDPAFLRLAFDARVAVEGRVTVVTIANRAGHRVPGLIGREIRFDAKLLDAAGVSVATGELALDTSSFLPVDGELKLELAGLGATVELTGMHTDPRAKEPVRFLTATLKP